MQVALDVPSAACRHRHADERAQKRFGGAPREGALSRGFWELVPVVEVARLVVFFSLAWKHVPRRASMPLWSLLLSCFFC